MAQNPPPVPAAPLPYDLQTDQQQIAGAPTFQNPRTGRIYPRQAPGREGGPLGVLDNPVTGVQHVGEGVSQMAEPGLREKAGGLHKVLGGTLEAATPLMVGAGAAAPVATAATVATGTGAQAGSEWALKKIGLPEEYAAVVGDLVGLFAAAKTPKTIAALKAKYEPVLKARFEKAKPTAPEPPGNSTGTRPYSPPTQPLAQRAAAQQPAPAAEPAVVDPLKRRRGERYSAWQDRIKAPPAQPVAAQPARAAVAPAPSPAVPPEVGTEQVAGGDAKLPRELRGARPRYSYGPKQFSLNFESDLDRAAYITAQKTPSKADAQYLKFAMDATGETEAAIRQHGREVRGAIKVQAKDIPAIDSEGNPVTLTVPDMARERFGSKPEKPAAAAAGEPEIGPHGPIYREYSGKPREALATIRSQKTGFAQDAVPHDEIGPIGLAYGVEGDPANDWKQGYGVAHIDAKHPGWLDANIENLSHWPKDQEFRDKQGRVSAVRLNDGKGNRVMVSRDWMGQPHPQWMITGYERSAPAASVGVRGTPEGAAPTPAATGRLDSSVADKPADRGPTYMGSGLGALEPLFREAKAEGDRLREARSEALKAAQAAEAKPEQMKAGEKLRAWFLSERDLWAARTNQAIDVVTRKVLPKIQDREALGIAREYRHHPLELQSWIDGTHPFLQDVDGGAAVGEENIRKLIPLLREAQRILTKPTARERAADAAFTNIADRDLQEGRAGGWLESRWKSDEYLPHAINPKGEGEVAKLPSTAGRAMGKIGKYFGFGERRSDKYPTMVHAVADGLIPKTLDPSALFTIHSDQFATARATHLFEAHMAQSGLGKWADRSSAPEGWVRFAPHADEFKKQSAYAVPGSFDPESRESELRISNTGLYVKPFIEKAMRPITDPDYLEKIPGYAKVRTAQRGLKEAILGLSGFHLLTENFMAAADIGPSGMLRAFRETREAPATLANERDLIASGGTTSIEGRTMEAYKGLRPGTIPTRAEVIRAYLPGTKQALQVADSITRFTFENVQRRFKIWSFALHRDAWIHDNPYATPDQLTEAKKGIASYVNGVYGGLHWENMGWSRAMVGVARLGLLAPDWSGSNVALAKYAFDAPLSPREIPFRKTKLAGATTKESAQARLSRAFWTKQLVGGMIATEMLSLMHSGQLSRRPFQVYMGKDKNGEEIYQNVFFRGSIGDAVNLAGKMKTHGKEGWEKNGVPGAFAGTLVGAGVFVAGKAAPFAKLGMHVITGRDDFGRDVTPGTLAQDVLPIPIVARTVQHTMLSDDSDKYLWSERILSLFGSPAQHVPPPGTHMSKFGLRPNTIHRLKSGR